MNSKPKPGKLFASGRSGNPKGSSAKQKEMGKITKLTNEQVHGIASLILNGDLAALNKIKSNKDASVLQVWISALIVKSINKGDPAVFRALMDRIIGKPKEAVEITGKDGTPLVRESLADMEAKLAVIRKAKEELGDD